MSNVCGAAFMRDGVFPGTIIRMDRIRHMGKGYFKLPLRPGIFRRRALDLTRQLTRAGRSSLTIFAMSPPSTVRKCRGTEKVGGIGTVAMGATLLRRPRLPPMSMDGVTTCRTESSM